MQIKGLPVSFESLCGLIVKLGLVDATVEKTTELLWQSMEDHGYTHRWDDPDQEMTSTERWFTRAQELKMTFRIDVIALLVDWSIMTGRMDQYHNDVDYKQHCRDWLPNQISVRLRVDNTDVTLHPPEYRYLQGGTVVIINRATSANGGGLNYTTLSLEEFIIYAEALHPRGTA